MSAKKDNIDQPGGISEDWTDDARREQQEYYLRLGDRAWDAISPGELTVLMRKVGFGLHGMPGELPNVDNKDTGYSEEKLKRIEEFSNKLIEPFGFNDEGIHFACFYIIARIDNESITLPMFRAKAPKASSCIFLDTSGRVYSSWGDWSNNEKLPPCVYCAPEDGFYQANSRNGVKITFRESRACNLSSKALQALDISSTVLSLGATTLGITSLFVPFAGPIMATGILATAGATGAYGIGRSTYELVDRDKHGQSISLADREARGHWLSIVGNSLGAGLGLAQGKLIASMTASAKAGEVMGKAGRFAFAAAQIGSLTVNGIGIAHGLENLVYKIKKDELTTLDVFQFTASILFFSHAAINFKTAGTIIKDVQNDTLAQYRAGMSEKATKVFNKKTGQMRGPREMHGNAEVIKTLSEIGNVQELFEIMADKNIDASKVKMVRYTEKNLGFKGTLRVNKDLRIHPIKLLKMDPKSRQVIFDSSRAYTSAVRTINDQVKAKTIDQATADTLLLGAREQHQANVSKICSKHRIKFDSLHEKSMSNLCTLYGKPSLDDIQVGGQKIFTDMTGHEKSRLFAVVDGALDNDPALFRAAVKFADSRGVTTLLEFLRHAEYLYSVLTRIKLEKLDEFFEMLRNGLSKEAVEKFFGITGSWEDFAERWARSFLFGDQRDEVFREFGRKFDTANDNKSPLSEDSLIECVKSGDLTVHLYPRHKYFERSGELTPANYFAVTELVIGDRIDRSKAHLSQNGDCTVIQVEDPHRGPINVMIVEFPEGGSTSGLAMVVPHAL